MVCIAPEDEGDSTSRNMYHSNLRSIIQRHKIETPGKEIKPAMHISDAWHYKR